MDAGEVIRWRPGETVLDTYRIDEVVETGGMGFVYRAHHLTWNVDLAVKTPRPDLAASPGILDLLAQEAQSWTDLGPHPNVVGCAYVRRVGAYPVVFAEWIAGGDLTAAVREGRCRDLRAALDVAIQTLRGIGHAHAAGLVHQDIKPSNIMYDGETARVTDFGTAKAKAYASEPAPGDAGTAYATLGGFTPQYCSPEQVDPDGRIGRASDMWSWALTVIEVLHGRRLWEWGHEGADALAALRADLPQALRDLLAGCLARDPRSRISDTAEAEAVLAGLYADCAGGTYPRSDRVPPALKADGLSNKALSLWDLGEQSRAVELFEQARAIDPHNVHVVYNHGLLRWADGLVTDETLLSELRATGDSWEADYLAAMVHLERGDGVLAARHLAEADRKHPGAPEIATARDRCARLAPRGTLEVFGQFTGEVAAMASDADATHVVVAETSGRVRIWDAIAGRVVTELADSGRTPVDVAIDHAGARVLVCYQDSVVERWRLTDGSAELEGRLDGGTAVALSPDGGSAAVGTADGRVLVFRAGGWEPVVDIRPHEGRVTRVILAPEAEVCVSASLGHPDADDRVEQWWPLRRTRMRGLHLPPDGLNPERRTALATDGSIVLRLGVRSMMTVDMRVWDEPRRWEVPWLLGCDVLGVSGRAGWALLDPGSGDLQVLELAIRRCVRTFPKDWNRGSHREVTTFSGDCGYAVVAERDGFRDRTSLSRLPMPLPGHLAPWSYAPPRPVGALAHEERAFDQVMARIDGMIAAGEGQRATETIREARAIPGFERHPRLRRAARAAGRDLERTGLHGIWLEQELSDVMLTHGAFDVSDSGRLFAFPTDIDQVEIVDLETLQKVGSVVEKRNPATSLRFARGGRDLIIGYSDGSVACHDTVTAEPRFKVAGAQPHDEGKTTLDVSGDLVTVGFGYGLATVWSLDAAARVATIRTGHGLIAGVTADEKSHSIAVHLRDGDATSVEVRSIDTGKPLRTFAQVDRHTEIRFASGVLLLAEMGRLTAWRPGRRRPLYRLDGVKHSSSADLAFADSRRLAAIAGMTGFVVWNAETGELVYDGRAGAEHPLHGIEEMAVSPDGRFAVTGAGGDETVDVWDLRVGRGIRSLRGHPVRVNAIRADASFRTIVTGDHQGNVRVWGLDWDHGSEQ
ncbi:serine/threonine-protein kinase [Micromonospora sp. WMMD1128]|uniref:WD40 repeat domain-containing serine/threonine protein kinase n=1 Tax=Micromonospora sp. WMMD1128 TaxID=3015150 RepID=UPI00248C9191|nr:serine/threonine-protein kinase [Micromonospora sp. WMMD1128]WBB76604.1 serine/threonine-protein kinase [Micromonospora sp. WMMD1128]